MGTACGEVPSSKHFVYKRCYTLYLDLHLDVRINFRLIVNDTLISSFHVK